MTPRFARTRSVLWHVAIVAAAMLPVAAAVTAENDTGKTRAKFQRIDGLYEPSGVVQLQDGRLVAVEDEPSRPFALLTPLSGDKGFRVDALRPRSLWEPVATRIGDLEGITVGPGGFVYTITSHSRKSNGKRDQEREKFVRFIVSGERMQESAVRGDFRKTLTRAYPLLEKAAKERRVKHDGGLNIEGLSFGPQGKRLWVGLRAPLVDKKAMLVAILNPVSAFANNEKFHLADEPVLLDLDGGGIRDISYDKRLQGYLIISQREGTKTEKAFKLWFWSGDPIDKPMRSKIHGVRDIERAEGVTPISFGNQVGVMLISDDGDKSKNRGARYIVIDYSQFKKKSMRTGGTLASHRNRETDNMDAESL